jgi:hypothetical protein
VRILHFGVKNEVPFLVMEYAPHGTIRDAHPQGIPLPLTKVVAYVDQIADALQYMHDRNLMHLDIKPLNVLLGEKPNGEKEVLLSDFGLVQTVQNTTSQIIPERVAGTAAYMDPDYMLGGPPRPASDQYALGVMVYEWLSGKRPFQGDNNRIVAQHQYNVPPPTLHNISGISREMERVVFRALKKDPKDRFPDVKTFAEAFKQACGDGSPSGKWEMSGTSSLQRREASSSSTGREGINRHAEQQLLDRLKKLGFKPNDNAWLTGKDGEAFLNGHMHEFIQTEQGKAWFSKKGEKWLDTNDGKYYMRSNAHKFIRIEQGEAWFSKKGEKWLDTNDGKYYMTNYGHEFIKTEQGEVWFSKKGEQWLDSDNGKEYMGWSAHEFIKTGQGKEWFSKKGEQWLDSDDGKKYIKWCAHDFIQTKKGKEWFSKKGEQWLDSDDGKEYMRSRAHKFIQTEQGKEWFNKYGKEWFKSNNGKEYIKKITENFRNSSL